MIFRLDIYMHMASWLAVLILIGVNLAETFSRCSISWPSKIWVNCSSPNEFIFPSDTFMNWRITVLGVELRTWDCYDFTDTYVVIRAQDTVTSNTETKWVFRCVAYVVVDPSSTMFVYDMSNFNDGKRVEISSNSTPSSCSVCSGNTLPSLHDMTLWKLYVEYNATTNKDEFCNGTAYHNNASNEQIQICPELSPSSSTSSETTTVRSTMPPSSTSGDGEMSSRQTTVQTDNTISSSTVLTTIMAVTPTSLISTDSSETSTTSTLPTFTSTMTGSSTAGSTVTSMPSTRSSNTHTVTYVLSVSIGTTRTSKSSLTQSEVKDSLAVTSTGIIVTTFGAAVFVIFLVTSIIVVVYTTISDNKRNLEYQGQGV